MKFQLFLIIAFICFASGWSKSIKQEGLSDLGEINGKNFFYDKNSTTWEGAKAICESFQLRQAEIRSLEELNFLGSKNSDDFKGHFWTAGVDVQSREQFKWDNSEDAISPDLPFFAYEGPFTCLYYFVDIQWSYMGAAECQSRGRYALCES